MYDAMLIINRAASTHISIIIQLVYLNSGTHNKVKACICAIVHVLLADKLYLAVKLNESF